MYCKKINNNNNKQTPLFPISRQGWAWLGMPGLTQPKVVVSVVKIYLHEKHLVQNLWSRIVPDIGFEEGTREITVRSFILGYFQQKVMNKFYESFRKLYFGSIFDHFCPFSVKQYFRKILFVDFYHCTKLKDSNKICCRRMDRQTNKDQPWIHRNCLVEGPKKETWLVLLVMQCTPLDPH